MNDATAKRQPELVWNAFIDLLAMEGYENLSPVQRVAHLAFWYDAEVQNGGHDQYFENRPQELIVPTIEALRTLGLGPQAEVLAAAAEGRAPSTRDFDAAYHRCSPTIVEALERYLAHHRDDFVHLV